jgi:hypothetical protein
LQEKKRHLYFYNPLEKSSNIEELGAQGSLGRVSRSRIGARLVPGKGVGVEYLKISVQVPESPKIIISHRSEMAGFMNFIRGSAAEWS